MWKAKEGRLIEENRRDMEAREGAHAEELQQHRVVFEEEIEKMKKDAEANAESDKKAKENADKLNSADQMIFQTERHRRKLRSI